MFPNAVRCVCRVPCALCPVPCALCPVLCVVCCVVALLDRLVHLLVANIYRTWDESMQAFDYLLTNGNFPTVRSFQLPHSPVC